MNQHKLVVLGRFCEVDALRLAYFEADGPLVQGEALCLSKVCARPAEFADAELDTRISAYCAAQRARKQDDREAEPAPAFLADRWSNADGDKLKLAELKANVETEDEFARLQGELAHAGRVAAARYAMYGAVTADAWMRRYWGTVGDTFFRSGRLTAHQAGAQLVCRFSTYGGPVVPVLDLLILQHRELTFSYEARGLTAWPDDVCKYVGAGGKLYFHDQRSETITSAYRESVPLVATSACAAPIADVERSSEPAS